ncbi:unnamed protein product, partial [Adineta ricciae]
TKQQWIEVFKPQYEQSKVYQYLKQSDMAYNCLVERKEALLNAHKNAYKAYCSRRQEFCSQEKLSESIVSVAKSYISRRDQLNNINEMKEKLIELENKDKQLMESKMDKMKAWESVYTQPMKRDLMDFCLQTNIDQVFTLSLNQIQQDIWSQPMTPTVLTPQNEQVELIPQERINSKPSVTFQRSPSAVEPMVIESIRSVPPSILHLTTAIDDDDDELFSASRRKAPPITQLEQMSLHDDPPSTQAFVVPTTKDTHMNHCQDAVPLTQAFTTVSASMKPPESLPIPSMDAAAIEKSHSSITVTSNPNRTITSAIQPQVTSNDVQQMLLTFSSDPSPNQDEVNQPMEDGAQQLQQRPTFSMASSIESTASTEEGYTGFNYNFGFNNNTTSDAPASGTEFTSPIGFDNWTHLGSPLIPGSNEQFSAFLQQANNADDNPGASFSFPSFNYDDLGNTGTTTDATFSSFFFGNGPSSVDKESEQNR